MFCAASISIPSITVWKSSRHRVAQRARDEMARVPGIKRVDLRVPGGECRLLVLGRASIVGDVVELAAEGIDRVHPVAAVFWQEPHRPIERAARRRDPLANALA